MEKKKELKILPANAFSGRTDDFKASKHEFTDTNVKEYALVNKISETKEDGEVLICAKPVLIKEYDLAKEVKARAKGQSLKEIVARMQFQGLDPIATLGANAESAVYDETGKRPSTLGEALDKGLESNEYLSKFNDAELANLVKLAKMDEKSLKDYFASIMAKQEVNEKQNVDKQKEGEVK